MGKDIILRRDGIPHVERSVSKINTQLVGGGSMMWLPEDETEPTDLYTTENGEYVASDEGFFGYSKVTVLIAGGGSATIERRRSDGTTVKERVEPPASSDAGSSTVTVDPETGVWTYHLIREDGTLEEKRVPSYAMVTTAPKTTYSSGETASYAGAVITLYYGDNTVATDWNNGVLSEGTQQWSDYVDTTSGIIDTVARNGIVIMHIKPWWYKDGVRLDRDYWLKAYYKVTIS